MGDTSESGVEMPDPALLQRLLEALDIPCEPGRLQAAVERLGAGPATLSTQCLGDVLAAAEVDVPTAILLPWQRFDPRRMPALVHFRGTWYFAALRDDARPDQTASVRLTNSAGEPSQATSSELDGSDVLWIRRPDRRFRGERPTLSANLAVQLVWEELFRDRGWLWQLVLATFFVNLIGVSTSLFAMQVYDRVVPTMAYATLTALAVGMAIVIILDWTLKVLRARVLDSLAHEVDQRCSQHVYEHLLHLQLDVQPRSLGTLAAQVSNLEAVRQFMSATVVFALVDLPFALMFLAFIAVIGGAVAWVYALLLPAALLLGLYSQWRLKGLFRDQLSRTNERQGLLVDTIRGAETVRASNAGWRFAQEWRELSSSINRFGIQQRALSSMTAVTTSSLSIVAYVSGVVVGVWQIEAGLLTMGGLIACTILGGRIIAPVAQSVQYVVQWRHVSEALAMVHQVLALALERRRDQTLLVPAAQTPVLALDEVAFSYGESPVRQLNLDRLHLSPGDRVLLAGPVGAGKSTLLKVLAGLYRPVEGRVRLGQADLWETDPLLVRGQIGYLPQAVHLFRGSLRSNLNLNGTAGDDRLLEISSRLGIDAIAAGNPMGMDLPISEGGDGLSGGQRQLLALARLFVQQPRIWLLDEPMASLDREAEERVWEALATHLQTDDILVVSTHRPLMASGLINRVLIMQQGSVVRDGKPEVVLPQLMQRRGRPHAADQGEADVV